MSLLVPFIQTVRFLPRGSDSSGKMKNEDKVIHNSDSPNTRPESPTLRKGLGPPFL